MHVLAKSSIKKLFFSHACTYQIDSHVQALLCYRQFISEMNGCYINPFKYCYLHRLSMKTINYLSIDTCSSIKPVSGLITIPTASLLEQRGPKKIHKDFPAPVAIWEKNILSMQGLQLAITKRTMAKVGKQSLK